jgi:hypothetical protein
MEQILVYVKDKDKAKLLLELLMALDFVELVDTDSKREIETTPQEEPVDFFSLAGLWEGRDISLESIRQH